MTRIKCRNKISKWLRFDTTLVKLMTFLKYKKKIDD